MKLALPLTILLLVSMLSHQSEISSEDVNFNCFVDGNITSINTSYSGELKVHNILWQFTNKSGFQFEKQIVPCESTTEYECKFTFQCHRTNESTIFDTMMIMCDVWSGMNVNIYFEEGMPKFLAKNRTECLELPESTFATVTTADTVKSAADHVVAVVVPIGVVLLALIAVIYFTWRKCCRKQTPLKHGHVDGSGSCYPCMCCKERIKEEMGQNVLLYDNQQQNVSRQLNDPDGQEDDPDKQEDDPDRQEDDGQHVDHDTHLDDIGVHLDDHNLQIEDIITELDDQNLQIEGINSHLDDHDMKIEDINIQLNDHGMELNENGRLLEDHCKQLAVNGRQLEYNGRHLEHLNSKLEKHDQQLENQGMQLGDHARKINRLESGNSITVKKFCAMKIYLPNGTPDAGTWLECNGKLYSNSNLVIDIAKGDEIDEIEIFLTDVWCFLRYGEHLCLACDIPTLPPESDISCLLAVPKKPSCKLKPFYILLDSEQELKEWVTAIINSIPQMLLQQNLITYYRKECNQLQINPFYAPKLLEIYISPSLKIRYQKSSKSQSRSKWISSYRDILMKNEIGKEEAYQNIYISSPAGFGKTSFCNRIALAWCHAHLPLNLEDKCFIREDIDVMRKFKFLFFISLRHAHACECYIDVMIQNLLLCNLANSEAYKELGLKFIQNLLNTEKCLVVLDGLDEWSHPQNKCTAANKEIPHNRAGSNCTVLTTSRHWKIHDVRLNDEETDHMLELNGLKGDMFEKLIDNTTQKMSEHFAIKAKASDFKKLLENKKLSALSNSPVIVMQLLTLWFDGEPIGESQCEIYSNMFEFQFKRYIKKKNDCKAEGKPTDSTNSSKCSLDIQGPVCFMGKVRCKLHWEYLLKIGHLAFDTLFSEDRESSLVFDRTVAEKYISDKDLEMSLNVGILIHDKKVSKRQSIVWFYHKTFQEFLAVLHVAVKRTAEELAVMETKIKNVCCSIENILDMSQVFMFMSGLCPQVLSDLCEPLQSVVSADKRTKKYRTSCELGKTSNEGKLLIFFQDTIMECLKESQLNGHNDVHLPISDVFIIDESPDLSDKFKFLIKVPVYSVFMGHIWEPKTMTNIFNSVTQFKSIQKLWLSDLPITLVHELNSRLRCPSTWQDLESVTIELVRGKLYKIICDLADCIIQLPKSVEVRFERCFSSQGTPDFRPYIRKHFQITKDVHDTELLTLQFHKL